MTQPSPDGQDGGSKQPAKQLPSVKVGEVVEFTHRDIITGRDITGIGVVVRAEKDDPTVAVRPLAHHQHEVALSGIRTFDAADVS